MSPSPSRRSAGATAAAVALMSVRDRIPDMGRAEPGPAAVSAQAAPIANVNTNSADGPISQSFEEMLGRLEAFYAENGRGAVLPPTSSLGVWAASQRLEKRHNLLSAEKEAALTRAGLEWAPHWSGVTWGQRYAELCDFHRKHGHCRVRYSGGGLGGWVSTQRRAKKAGRLSEERTRKLEDIGFIWDARPDGDGRGIATRPADGESGTMGQGSGRVSSGPAAYGNGRSGSLSGSGSGSSVMEGGGGVGIGVGMSGASMPLSSSPRAVQWSSEGGAVSALTRAVNRAIEEREAEQAARAAAAGAAAASTGSAVGPSPPPQADVSGKTTLVEGSSENVYSGPPRLPAKKRLRAGGYHYPGEYPPPADMGVETGRGYNYDEGGGAMNKSLGGGGGGVGGGGGSGDRHASWYGSSSVVPGVTSIVTAAPRRLGETAATPPAEKRGRRQALPGVRDRVRALVGEIVAETLAPPTEAGGGAVAGPPPDSSVRRWARETYVGMSDETLNRVVADGARQS